MPKDWLDWVFAVFVTVGTLDIFIVPTIKRWFKK